MQASTLLNVSYLAQMWNISLCSKAVLFIAFVLWVIEMVLKQGLGEIMSSAGLKRLNN